MTMSKIKFPIRPHPIREQQTNKPHHSQLHIKMRTIKLKANKPQEHNVLKKIYNRKKSSQTSGAHACPPPQGVGSIDSGAAVSGAGMLLSPSLVKKTY